MRTFNYHMLARILVEPWVSLDTETAITHTQTSKG